MCRKAQQGGQVERQDSVKVNCYQETVKTSKKHMSYSTVCWEFNVLIWILTWEPHLRCGKTHKKAPWAKSFVPSSPLFLSFSCEQRNRKGVFCWLKMLPRSSGADGKGTFGGEVRAGLLTIKMPRCLRGSTLLHPGFQRCPRQLGKWVWPSCSDRTVSKGRKLAEAQLSPKLPSNPRPTFPMTGLR